MNIVFFIIIGTIGAIGLTGWILFLRVLIKKNIEKEKYFKVIKKYKNIIDFQKLLIKNLKNKIFFC